MKLKPTLLLLILLTSAGSLHAQKPATPAKTPADAPAPVPPFQDALAATAPRWGKDGTLQLFSGPLPQVVEQVEDIIPLMAGQGEASSRTMPNLLWGPGTLDLMVPTDLRLRRVTPLQVLTLVAAAAGCTLEPIIAPEEKTGGGSMETAVVGYRVIRDTRQPGEHRLLDIRLPDHTTRLTELRAKLEAAKTALGAQHPSFTQLREELSRLEQTNPNVLKQTGPGDVRLTPGIKVVEPLHTGIFMLDRPAPATSAAEKGADTRNNLSLTAENAASAPLAASPDTPLVRIYAVGALLAGQAGDRARHTQQQINELVTTALVQAEANSPGPQIAFHDATKVIVAKGSPTQHEIISQVLTALKENQQAEAAGGKP